MNVTARTRIRDQYKSALRDVGTSQRHADLRISSGASVRATEIRLWERRPLHTRRCIMDFAVARIRKTGEELFVS